MAKMPAEKLIPFDFNGHMIEEAAKSLTRDRFGKAIDWRKNVEFQDTLRFVEVSGYRTLRADFLTSMDKKVSMFFDDFKEVIPLLVLGQLQGTFTYANHSSFYAIKLIDQEPT